MKADKKRNVGDNLQQKIKDVVFLAKQKKLIRSCNEAFTKYPVEEEQHKGKIQAYNLK